MKKKQGRPPRSAPSTRIHVLLDDKLIQHVHRQSEDEGRTFSRQLEQIIIRDVDDSYAVDAADKKYEALCVEYNEMLEECRPYLTGKRK